MSAERGIRVARPADAAAIAEIYRPAVLESATSFELEAPDAVEMERRIARTLEQTPWLVAVEVDDVIGYAYATRHRDRAAYQWSVEVSAYVRARAQRGGVARTLYEALFRVLSAQGYYNAYAGITLPNAASTGFHEALGFRLVGVYHEIGFKNGGWHDVGWYERALRPHSLPAGAPTPFAIMRGNPEVEQLLLS